MTEITYGKVYAALALEKSSNWLVPAGRGHQPGADFNRGDFIGESLTFVSERGIQVLTTEGKKFHIQHGNYQAE